MSDHRWCPSCRTMRVVVDTHDEGTTERHPTRYIVSELDCGHNVVDVAADQAERS